MTLELECRTQIARKDGLYSRTSLIYKYETSTITPFVKPCAVLNLDIQIVFYLQSYVESTFTCNPGSTDKKS